MTKDRAAATEYFIIGMWREHEHARRWNDSFGVTGNQ
jgi:hypothetical protein